MEATKGKSFQLITQCIKWNSRSLKEFITNHYFPTEKEQKNMVCCLKTKEISSDQKPFVALQATSGKNTKEKKKRQITISSDSPRPTKRKQ
jgi:hypothetical protein